MKFGLSCKNQLKKTAIKAPKWTLKLPRFSLICSIQKLINLHTVCALTAFSFSHTFVLLLIIIRMKKFKEKTNLPALPRTTAEQLWSCSCLCFKQKFCRHDSHLTGTSWNGFKYSTFQQPKKSSLTVFSLINTTLLQTALQKNNNLVDSLFNVFWNRFKKVPLISVERSSLNY